MAKHRLARQFVERQVNIALIGAGGTGSRILEQLVNLNRAMLALGHPEGLNVTLIDDDRVSEANVGRQAFYPCDVNQYKASVLINRANMAMGDHAWKARIGRVTAESELDNFGLVIGAVDNRLARKAIVKSLSQKRYGGWTYYLDTGNRADDGQVVLGQVARGNDKSADRLPHIGELFPELIDASADNAQDDLPSCSLAQALQKQSLYINPAMSLFAMNLLWSLFTKGEIDYHGAFINLASCTVRPLPICHETWKRFGVKRDWPDEEKASASLSACKAVRKRKASA
jgi:PRTRC genetic system ThiF family protein